MENQTKNSSINSNEKRLQSLKTLKKTYQNQKLIIQSALSNIDKGSHKIIFDEALEDPLNNIKSTSEKNVQDLFDNDSDNDNFEVDFSVKKQFEGEKGQKLLELQSQYKNDKRFVLSERFLDDTPENTVIENGFKQENEEMSLEKEKKREFEILDQILQEQHIKPKLINEKKIDREKKFMVRFDPTQPQHTKYEIKKDEIQVKNSKKDKNKKMPDVLATKKSEETEAPEVPKTLFYQVKGNLKDTLQTNNQVSLLSMFGTANENDYENVEEEKEEHEVRITKPNLSNEKNPFKYDSSDDEEGQYEEEVTEMNGISEHEEATNNKMNLCVETFFFKEDDYRLQEGFDFVERMKLEDNTEFSKSRRELKEIVKTKIRNVQQKKKMFKNKLGGSKRRRKDIRIKKALKK